MRRTLLALASGLLTLTLLLAGSPAAYARDDDDEKYPTVINLPNGWQPEGIASGKGSTVYAGSLATGSIYAADVKTGEGMVAVTAPAGRTAVGLKYDQRTGYLFVAGGGTGQAFVYDAKSGAAVADFSLGGGFINDVIITRDAAYFTNSAAPVFYRLPLGPGGKLPTPGAVQTIPLSGEWEQVQGFNANGIVAGRNGRYLVIVNSTVGKLFRVDPVSGAARAIDLGGYSVTQGDGLLLDGRTLYVLRNRIETVAVIELASNFLSGELVTEIKGDPNNLLDVPTTIAEAKGGLYVVNARFGTPPTPDTTYTIVRLEQPED